VVTIRLRGTRERVGAVRARVGIGRVHAGEAIRQMYLWLLPSSGAGSEYVIKSSPPARESVFGNIWLTAATKSSELERMGTSNSLGSIPGASDMKNVKVLDGSIVAEYSKWIQ